METVFKYIQKEIANIKFKSYYVVWKQTKGNDHGQMTQSLNRTMQYGNCQSVYACIGDEVV